MTLFKIMFLLLASIHQVGPLLLNMALEELVHSLGFVVDHVCFTAYIRTWSVETCPPPHLGSKTKAAKASRLAKADCVYTIWATQGCSVLWHAIFRGTGGSENEPLTICWNIHLLAASVKCTPSQIIRTDGSLHELAITTSVPFTVILAPHLLWLL